MWAQIYPLAILALIIIFSIGCAIFLFWHFGADTLDPDKIKRANKGRRRSDQ